ncbi:MAG: ABC transporter ATP-binding protein [Bacilli bacterium]|nr:ABC transporter ATP-binding protein [Bacilli bacterium]MDD4607671.1 ABC transporter ATP-binding protein [Bacilli bacterium]
MKNFLKLFKFLKPYKKWALLAPILITLEVVMELMLPNIMSNIINIGIANNDFKYIILSSILMILITVIGVLGGIGSTYYAAKASGYGAADMRKEIFKKISNLSILNLDKVKPGHLITVITNDINIISNVLMMSLRLLFRVPVILIGSIFMVIIISPKLSLILVFIIPLMAIVVGIIVNKAFPYFQIMQDGVDNVNTTVRENLGGIRVVKAFVNEKHEMEKFDQVNKKLMDITIKGFRFISLVMPTSMIFINIATLFILWYGGIEVIGGNLLVGDIIAFIQYLTNILTSIIMTSMVVAMLARSEVSASRVNEIFEFNSDLEDIENPLTISEIKGKVEFKNVSFSYEGGTGDAVLKNINFVVEAGDTIGIIGATGSGKSSLVNLIPRFYEVSDGEILIDDINIKNYRLDFLREKIGIALQQAFIFSDTIKDNIKYGYEEATDEEIIEAAKIAEAHDFINSKKKGYDELLEQRGTNLSGGQKQRIVIARTILPKPSIIIFDDTTSAIDVTTDKKIRASMRKHLKDTTTFIVASRVASIMDANKIIVLDDGKVMGFGTHEQLLKNNSIYQDIYYSQMSKGEMKDE